MSFDYRVGLHGCDAGEDLKKLVMAFWGDLAEEEEFVHRIEG